MKRAFKWVGIGVVLAMLAALVWEPLSVRTQPPPPDHSYDSQIVRDSFGVPHIKGKTDADAAYGLAYAHAEDDFATLQEVIAMTRGRSAAMTGKAGAAIDYVRALLGSRETAEAAMPAMPATVRAVIDGYAAGLNHYADKHPSEVRLRKLFPVNAVDVTTGFVLRSPFFFGLDGVIKDLNDGKTPSADTVAPMTPVGRDPSMNGSNAFALAPKKMADGKTWLISNAHQPYEGGVAWYEAIVHSDEGLDMAGATFPGSPFILLGHNRNLGWTNTVNQPDLIDVYKLKTSADGASYQFDGKWLPLESKRIWIGIKLGPFTLPYTKTVYRSHLGPVIRNANGSFLIRYGGMGQGRMMEQYFRIQKAQNYDQWIAAMKLRGIVATNFIYADKSGRIAYFYNALFPKRKPGFDYTKVLAGDTSANQWTEIVPWEATPMVVGPQSGFVTNENNHPFLAAGAGSELDRRAFSPLLGLERRETNRIHRAIELLSADPALTPEELLRIKFDTGYSRKSHAGRWIAKLLAVDVSKEPDLLAAQKLLAQWDFNSDANAPADTLGEAMMHLANSDNYHGRPLREPRGALREAVDRLMKCCGRIDPPLGQVQRLIHGTVDIPANGGTDTLRAATGWEPMEDGRMRVYHGDSFIMLINWDKAGKVFSQSIQPYGSAPTRPASPHYTDQMKLFEAHKFKPVHFEWGDALKYGGHPYRP
jgi:acyl-homoserine-lactone acylase